MGSGHNISAEHGSRQPMFLVTTAILLLLSTVVVALRLYCRIVRIRNIGLDDYFIVAALFVTIGLAVMNAHHISWGTGQHLKYLNLPEMRIPTLKHFFFYQLVYPFALFLVKASILALYYRIFAQVTFRYYIHLVAGFVTVYTVVVLFVVTFECRPKISQAWAPSFPKGCNSLRATYIAVAAINIVTDITIFLMPLRAFWRLEIAQRKRWALLGVFMVGGVAVIASIVRIYALWLYKTTKDISYDSIILLLLSQIELNIAIISATLPTILPLFRTTTVPYEYSGNYPNTIGSSPTANNHMSRNRTRPSAHFELFSFSEQDPRTKQKMDTGGRSNTSEESILKQHGIKEIARAEVELEQSHSGGSSHTRYTSDSICTSVQ